MMGYTYTAVKAWAVINGFGTVDISSVRVAYALNSIPVATAVMPVGFNAASGGLSRGPDLITLAKQRTRAVLYASTNGVERKVFEGYLSGVGESRDGMSMGIQLQFVHWSEDLAGTSALSDRRTPNALYDVTAPIEMGNMVGLNKPMFSLNGMFNDTALFLKNDFGTLLTTIMKNLAKGTIDSVLTNATAQRALARVSPYLIFNFAGSLPTVREGVARMVVSAFVTVYAGGTLWSSLQQLYASLLFCSIPTVNWIYLMPFAPTNKIAAYTLSSDEYVYVNTSGSIQRAIQALVLYDTKSLASKIDIESRQPVAMFCSDAGAVGFTKSGNNKYTKLEGLGPKPVTASMSGSVTDADSGLIDAAPIPPWLRDAFNMGTGMNTLDIIAGIRSRSDVRSKPKTVSYNQRYNANNQPIVDIGLRYAWQLYGARKFAGSSAKITCPLRFDIVPGQTMKLMAPVNAGTEKGIYAFIESVSITIDADRASASTEVSLTHTRSEADNAAFGIDGSALYLSLPTTTKLDLIEGASSKTEISSGATMTWLTNPNPSGLS